VVTLSKKDQHIIPLNEDEYDKIETYELSYDVDGFANEDNINVLNMEFNENYLPNAEETPIRVFSFNSNDENKNHSANTYLESNDNLLQNKSPNDSFKTKYNINNKTESTNLHKPQLLKVRGLTPSINGEAFDIKRCYQFRASTLKKLNQLKGESDNINIYLNEIIDSAICFYHNAVFNEK
jgi:hypothetical protein